jgi:uncharacterized protein (TIGR00299 family) protein
MRIAYLDCFSGISGDMFLGALLDAGVPFDLFEKAVADLNIGASLERSRVDRAGISATKLDVVVNGEKDMPPEEFWQPSDRRSVAAGQTAGAVHHHHHEQPHSPQQHGEGHGRTLSEILKIVAGANISDRAQHLANQIFLALATAEAKVHNAAMEDIHFHEVGAADAVVDVVCAAVGAEALGVEQFVCSPLNVGGGTVSCAHGTFPVPAPATLELLKDAPIYSGEVEKELVTPTGAAIVKVLASSFGPRPVMTTEAIGYGAGTRDFSRHANVLRMSIGDSAVTGVAAFGAAQEETVAILEANVDDLNPQLIGYLMDQAFAAGALDVFTTPVQMKKNRPGTMITILAPPDREHDTRELLFRESSTLGVRVRHETRYVLPRRYESVVTCWGEVRMKVAGVNGISQYAPEYEDCRRIAAEHHVPLKHVMQEAIRLYLDRQHG